MARDYLQRAKWCLDEAILPRERNDYAGTARRSQEALELAAKALLRAHAIEYPREHDVSEALTNEKQRFTAEIQAQIEHLAALVRELASIRGPAMYGLEREGIPPSKTVEKREAMRILNTVYIYVEKIDKAITPHL
jgi:HEPN domain-containing protein